MPDNTNLSNLKIEKKEEEFAKHPEVIEGKMEKIAPILEKEKIIGKAIEQKERGIYSENLKEKRKDTERTGGAALVPIISEKQKERKKKIEKVLAKGLEDAYMSMTPEKKREFKTVGEQTAGKISELLEKGKVKVKKIIELIKKWLALIPGVNRFFLEQEAKIKADEIMRIKRQLQ